ncbi:MAG: sigma 54-interacting transcriptional regulator, partial [Planctomycetaceae bacterium]
DFDGAQAGGHAEDRLLETWQRHLPAAKFVLITAHDCPEPLERRAACTDITHLRGRIDTATLAKVLQERIATIDTDPRDPALPGRQPSPCEGTTGPDAFHRPGSMYVPVRSRHVADAEAVLTGITRRFETNTPRLRHMLGELEIAARHDVTILLIGETGAGKTYLSRLIHEVSPRRTEPFLHVACGALPGDLIESELFGHVKGAFTGAHADKEGKFLVAARGTVLLDEIDVLGPEQQVKLLRVIETGEFEPVGSNRTHKGQARLVVASNLELEPLVAQGKFRPDLYYRLNMLKFDVLPLRERRPDIVPLARKFVEQSSAKYGIEVRSIEDGLFDALLAYPWPGNVRELEHVMQRAVIYCREGVLTQRHLPSHIVAGVAGPTNDPSVSLGPGPRHETSLGRQIAVTERDI